MHAVIPVRVRYPECDPMGIAHHASYLTWMEIARTDLLRLQGAPYRDCEASGVFFVVARLNIRYKLPARYDDEIEIHIQSMPCKGVKLDHHYEIKRDDQLLVTAQTTLVCVDSAGKVRPVPSGLLP